MNPTLSSRLALAATIAALLAAACGGAPPPPDAITPGAPIGTGSPSADTVARYGHGPQPDQSITYQPDVVLIGTGPAAIRGVSADGMTFTLDPAAAGVAELSVGQVMFASARAVGRVLALERTGAGAEVTLGPVELTEVIRDGHIRFHESISLDELAFVEVGQPADSFEDVPADLAGEGHVPADGAVALRLPEIRLAAAAPPDPRRQRRPVSANAREVSQKVGDWNVTAYTGAGKVGLRAERGLEGADLKVSLDANLDIGELDVIADVPISRGELGSSLFRVSGINGLNLSIVGGAGNGLSDNRKVKIEIPVVLTRPVIIGGFPAMLSQKFKFLVNTAFTAKNGNLSAEGSWAIDGPIGYEESSLVLPTVTERGTKLVDSIAGVSVGVNGLVVAISFEFGLLIGLPVAGAGPVASFITSLGLTNGSSLGIVQCRQSTITSTLTAGVGIQTLDTIRNALKLFYDVEIPEQKKLLTKTIVQETWYAPAVRACAAGDG